MTDKLTNLKNKLTKLEEDKKILKKEIEINTNESLSVGIKLLRNDSSSLSIKYNNLQKQFLILSQKLTKLEEEYDKIKIETERLQ